MSWVSTMVTVQYNYAEETNQETSYQSLQLQRLLVYVPTVAPQDAAWPNKYTMVLVYLPFLGLWIYWIRSLSTSMDFWRDEIFKKIFTDNLLQMTRRPVQCIALALVCDATKAGDAVGQLVTWRAGLAAAYTVLFYQSDRAAARSYNLIIL